jgi:hypothetical protein
MSVSSLEMSFAAAACLLEKRYLTIMPGLAQKVFWDLDGGRAGNHGLR